MFVHVCRVCFSEVVTCLCLWFVFSMSIYGQLACVCLQINLIYYISIDLMSIAVNLSMVSVFFGRSLTLCSQSRCSR
jgi:hypothetical protein